MVEQEPICRLFPDGTKQWYLNRKLHREDGPAVEYTNGDKCWFINDKLHRLDGPAVESIGDKQWCLNGKRHREDGPAVECSDGDKFWFLNGKKLTEEKYNEEIAKLNASKIHELW